MRSSREIGVCPRDPPAAPPPRGRLRKRLWLELVLILALTTLAFAVRVYRLPDIPPGLHSDEAANGVDVLDILGGHNSIFFERNSGREPLFIYLQAVAVGLFGTTSLALRLTSAIIGALTIPAIYWMRRHSHFGPRDSLRLPTGISASADSVTGPSCCRCSPQ
jgi:hypothetical protein